MNEQYVSFETAKLLKEKGFEWQTEFVWYECLPPSIDWRNKANQKAIDYFYFNETTEHHSYYRNCDKKPSYISRDIYSAPTMQMALCWLKEEKGMYISVVPDFNEYGEYPDDLYWLARVYDLRNGDYIYSTKLCISSQEAFDTALEYCLTSLI